jgi:hypothetical protein
MTGGELNAKLAQRRAQTRLDEGGAVV